MRSVMFSAIAKFLRSTRKSSQSEVEVHQPDVAETIPARTVEGQEPLIDCRGVYNSCDSPHDLTGRRTSMWLQDYLASLHGEVTMLEVIDCRLEVYVGKRLVFQHHSKLPIHDAVIRYRWIPAHQIIRDLTGKWLPPEKLVVLTSARFHRRTKGWIAVIPRPILYHPPPHAA